jgi:integrase
MNNWKVDSTKILSRTEIAEVIADLKRRARRSVNTRMNLAVFRLATCCGLRVSEIAGLKVQNVRVGIKKPYLYLPKNITKGKKGRRVPLWWDQGTLDDIVDWKTERQSQGAISTDYFVCAMSKSTFGSCIDPRNLRNRFISSCRILGKERQKHLTIHHGRHSFVSHSLFGGRSLAEVRDAAGHSNISITSVYAHIVSDDDGNGNLFDFEIENIKKIV